jgi:ribonucleoside-diphosphate reductase alpha chain
MSSDIANMNVIKRNGSVEPFNLLKWQQQISKVCEGIADVSPSMIEIGAQAQFKDGMTTRELDQIALQSMVNLIDEELNPDVGNVNYQYVAGKQMLTMLRKDVYGKHEPPRLYEIVKKNVELKLYTEELLQWYTEEEWDYLEKHIEHERDEELSYAAIAQLIEKYLIRNRATNQIVETPQVRYMIAAATMFHCEKKNRLKWVKEFYLAASDGQFTLATPVLAGLGTKTKQFSSCVLIRTDDTLKSIFATGQIMADYASKRAGIGLDIGRMRPLGASIRNGEVMHTGIIPFLKKWYADLRSCSQGGIRNASATVNMPIWHYQIDDFLVLKNNKGTEETRIRQLDYCAVASKFFWRLYKNDEMMTLFDPNEVPDMYKAFYENTGEFERLYKKYSADTTLRTKKLPARTVMGWFIDERSDMGRIYLLNIDNVMNQGPFIVEDYPTTQTNLCTEIMLPTVPFQSIEDPDGMIALCTLGSTNWGKFRHPTELRNAIRLLQRGLHNLLANYQEFLSIHSGTHNRLFEPLGIGITNLAYWHAKRKLKYGEPEALAEVKRWIEHQSFYLTEMSVDLAKEFGPCEGWKSTWASKGVFTWERRAEGSNELTDFTPSDDLNWEGLRKDMVAYGIRNATTGAIAPVESSSVVLNSTNGINMVKSLIVTKRSKAGDFVQVVPEYKKLKKYYQLMWDQPDCVEYLKTAAVLQVYVDQGISTDTFYSPRHFKDGKISRTMVVGNLMRGIHWGLKSFYYHLVEKQATLEVKEEPTIEQVNAELAAITEDTKEEEYCESCVL